MVRPLDRIVTPLQQRFHRAESAMPWDHLSLRADLYEPHTPLDQSPGHHAAAGVVVGRLVADPVGLERRLGFL